MTKNHQPESDLAAEFRRLGENFKDALQTAWESEERKNLSREIQTGLNAFGESIGQAADEFIESPTGQRVRADLDDLAKKVQSGEVVNGVREKLLEVLRKVNVDIEEALEGWTTPAEDPHADSEG